MRRIPLLALLACWPLLDLGAAESAPPVAPADPATPRVSPIPGVSRPVPTRHPRLLGSAEDLRRIAQGRSELYARIKEMAASGKDMLRKARIVGRGLVYVVDGDEAMGRQAVDEALEVVRKGVKSGHYPFGTDVADAAFAYDLCHPLWTEAEREEFHAYFNGTVDKNVKNEDNPLHNAYYGYKNYGYGIAAYATYYENPRSPQILADLEHDYVSRAAPVLRRAGKGGAWVEGSYDKTFTNWMLMMEVAERVDGADWYATAPEFWRDRALTIAFSDFPGIAEGGTRTNIPGGDENGGGKVFHSSRDGYRIARMILVDQYREDPRSAAIHAYNLETPRPGFGYNLWKDLLLADEEPVAPQPLERLQLSHIAEGVGNVYARSSWKGDATYLFFTCGDRFTSHQHLDVGNFVIYKRARLVDESGEYHGGGGFGSEHDVNYHLRTVAHNCIRVYDPTETWHPPEEHAWRKIRARNPDTNDGGQRHDFPHHNGAASSIAMITPESVWERGDIVAFEDRGDYVYVAGDCTRAYKAGKLESWVRQIVYLRPNTFVIHDRVVARDPAFKKTWTLHVMAPPVQEGERLVMSYRNPVTNEDARLFVQPLLPQARDLVLRTGDDVFEVDGKNYKPEKIIGEAPGCRIDLSPTAPAAEDVFVTVLTAAGGDTAAVAPASLQRAGDDVIVVVGQQRVRFRAGAAGGSIVIGDYEGPLAEEVDAGSPVRATELAHRCGNESAAPGSPEEGAAQP